MLDHIFLLRLVLNKCKNVCMYCKLVHIRQKQVFYDLNSTNYTLNKTFKTNITFI